MKKYLLTMAILLTVCQLTFAQNISSIINEFKNEKNAECIHISPFMMSIGKLFMGNEEGTDIVRKVKSMRILDLEDCSVSVKERFAKRVAKLNKKGYETLMQVNDDGEKVRILTKTKNDMIREMLIFCIEDKDCSLIQMSCKIKKEDIAQLVNEQISRKKHERR